MQRAKGPSREKTLEIESLTGGLDTNGPAHRLPPSRSPDLSNVLIDGGAVKRRGGFTPFVREHLPGGAVRNRGILQKTSIGDALTVSGALYAGDRPVWEDLDSYTIELFFRPENLILEHIGHGQPPNGQAGIPRGYPFPIMCRPILSKGPVKRSITNKWDSFDSGFGPPAQRRSQHQWNRASSYGRSGRILVPTQITFVSGSTYRFTLPEPHGGTGTAQAYLLGFNPESINGVRTITYSGTDPYSFTVSIPATPAIVGSCTLEPPEKTASIPFCIWLGRDNEQQLNWKFRASIYSIVEELGVDKFRMSHLVDENFAEEGRLYHVILTVLHGSKVAVDGVATMQIGTWMQEQNDGAGGFYYTNSTSVSIGAKPANSPTPIQVFDCPQEFIEAPGGLGVGSYTSATWDSVNFRSRPPGLGMLEQFGGYWFRSKRAEGTIQEIVVWSKTDTISSFQRHSKIDLDAAGEDIVQYWSFDKEGIDLVQEITGRGNHLYRVPRPPVLDDVSGGPTPRKASLWFNGVSSYMTCDLKGNRNWSENNIQDAERQYDTQRRGVFERAVRYAQPHGVRVDFWVDDTADGYEQVLFEAQGAIRLTIRPDGRIAGYCRNDTQNSASAVRQPLYTWPVTSPFTVESGKRYSATLVVTDGFMLLFVNGSQVSFAPVDNGSLFGWPVGALTIGAGCKQFIRRTDNQYGLPDENTPDENSVNTDSRSHFIGRIEFVELLAGEGILTRGVTRGDPLDEDVNDEHRGLYSLDSSRDQSFYPRSKLVPLDEYDKPVFNFVGELVRIAQYAINGTQIRADVIALIGNELQVSPILPGRDGGVTQLSAVAARISFVLARFALDRSNYLAGSSGCHTTGIEWRARTNGFTGIVEPNQDSIAAVETQTTDILDEMECLGPLEARSREIDLISEHDQPVSGTSAYAREAPSMQHRNRPYEVTPTLSLCPSWSVGRVPAATGLNPVSLFADWQHQPTGELLTIAAASRGVFWIRDSWRKDTPFSSRDDWSVLLGGDPNEHIKLSQDARAALSSSNVVAIEIWVKPISLSGVRAVISMADFSLGKFNPDINWLAYTDEGRIVVFGENSSATGKRKWAYREEGDGGFLPRGSSLKVGSWNHLYILVGRTQKAISDGVSGDVHVWVNGNKLTMVKSATGDRPLFDTPFAQGAPVYLGGIPEGFSFLNLIDGWAEVHGLCGLLTELQVSNAEDATRFSSLSSVAPAVPRLRYAAGANTVMLVHLNEGDGDFMEDDVSVSRGGPARFRRVSLIGELEESSIGARFSSAVFRDRLYISNGKSLPREIVFNGLGKKKPFDFYYMGNETPVRTPNSEDYLELVYDPQADPVAEDTLEAGLYQAYVSFVDKDGRESDPGFLFEYDYRPNTLDIGRVVPQVDNQNRRTGEYWFFTDFIPEPEPEGRTKLVVQLIGLTRGGSQQIPIDGYYKAEYVGPRQDDYVFSITEPDWQNQDIAVSNESRLTHHIQGFRFNGGIPLGINPSIVARKIYLSGNGGGLALEHTFIQDNLTRSVELIGGGSGLSVEFARRLPPPKCRHIAVGQGALFFANAQFDPSIPAGENLLAWSDGIEPIYFPASQQAIVDSEDGKPILSVKSHLGRLQIMKRDSAWTFTFRANASSLDPGAFLTVVNQSVGLGGGAVVFNNGMIGASEDGVYAFDSSTVRYLSDALTGLWKDIPTSDEDLLNMFGVFRIDEQQYWLSLRMEDTVERRFRPSTPPQLGEDLRPPEEFDPIELQDPQRGNSSILVLHTTEGDRQGPAWTKLLVPEHTFMAKLQRSGKEFIVLGTSSGSLLFYNEDTHIDGANEENEFGIKPVLDNPYWIDHDTPSPAPGPLFSVVQPGPAVSGMTVNSLTISAATAYRFTTIGAGLRGSKVGIVYFDATLTLRSAVRTIESNSGTVIRWKDALPYAPEALLVAFSQFVIGSYDAYWTSPWMSLTGRKGFVRLSELFFEFEPQDALSFRDGHTEDRLLTVSYKAAATRPTSGTVKPVRSWQASNLALKSVSMTSGVHECPVGADDENRGRYVRVLFGNGGIRAPFAVDSMALVFSDESDPRGGKPR